MSAASLFLFGLGAMVLALIANHVGKRDLSVALAMSGTGAMIAAALWRVQQLLAGLAG
jgi:hypothetical protein